MGEKLGLLREGETAFMSAYLQRVRALPGRGRFRTGVSLRIPFKEPSEGCWPGSPEDRFIIFVSFPYFGGSSEIMLDSESESVKLLDFKHVGFDVSNRSTAVSEQEERDDIDEILVHQARYMIFDNCKL